MIFRHSFWPSFFVFLGLLLVFLFSVYFGDNQEENMTEEKFALTSSAFENMGKIPSKYTCDADPPAGGLNPPLEIHNIPGGTQSMVLLMDDPDIPDFVKEERGIEKFDHWVLYGIPPTISEINEGELVGSTGLNSAGDEGYRGPCPPDGEHRYFFKLYALSGNLNFIKAPTLDEVKTAIEGSVIAETELVGLYERQ